MSAIIPVQRMQHHVRRLVLKGYKVGVIKQAETAALKAAGEKKNDLFSRELYAMYTKATLIGEEFCVLEHEEDPTIEDIYDMDSDSNFLVCISESPCKNKKSYNIAIVGVQLTTGNFTYCSFEDDSALRIKLESCLHQLSPSEILIPDQLSKETESLINGYNYERLGRIEKFDSKLLEYPKALSKVSSFYTENQQISSSQSENVIETILALPSAVISCLAILIEYLTSIKLENIIKNIESMKMLSTNESMVLTTATLKGLELVKNNSTHAETKSLFWLLNKTFTKFGKRMLKSWILKPLKSLEKINERLEILTEIKCSDTIIFNMVEKILSKLPDLERILCSVFYQKCSCYDFMKLVESLLNIQTEFTAMSDKIKVEIKSQRMKHILFEIPISIGNVEKYITNIDPEAAKLGDKTKIFNDLSMFPELRNCKNSILKLEKQINDLRPEISKTLKQLDTKYVCVAGQKFLIEVSNDRTCIVPKNWLKVSSTKKVSRYRSPEIIEYSKKIDQQNELMIGFANEAWYHYLNDFGKNFYRYKRAISYLAELDCYFSFAKISKEEEFCRPQVLDAGERLLNIVQGRHPVASKLLEGKQFVANDINMNVANNCVIVTGPNMGGKSTYIRQTAIIILLAHIGCYVPAESATIPLFDNIYVRIGADDDLVNRRSTFMVEMCEASEILSSATSKSFTVLDELGRGTSTNDGTAIAYSTLEYLISEISCFTLFVTHYPEILELKDRFPSKVSTVTMGYILKDKNDDSDIETVTFLYNVISGVSEKSYGINVAAIAGISTNILSQAHKISKCREMKIEIIRRLKILSTKMKSCGTDSTFMSL